MARRRKSKRNKLQLPIDIISLIFDHAAVIDPPHRRHRVAPNRVRPTLGWITLTHVCSSWRAVALSTPTLWAAIVTTLFNTSAVTTFLARAGSCPLTLDFFEGFPVGRTITDHREGDDSRSNAIISLLKEHLSRAGVLTVHLTDFQHHGGEVPSTLPSLYRIHVTRRMTAHQVPGGSLLQTLELNAPKLRSATLQDVILSSDRARGLRELRMDLSRASWASLKEIHDFMRCCTQLETLRIDFASPISVNGLHYHPREIRLANLKRARLYSNSDQSICDIWRPVVTQDDIVIHVDCTSVHTSIETPLFEVCAAQMLSGHYDVIDLAVDYAHRLRIIIYKRSAQHASHAWMLSTYQHNRGDLLCLLPNHIRAELIRTLAIDSTFGLISDSSISDVLRVFGTALTGLTELKLRRMNQWPASLYVRAVGRGKPGAPAFRSLRYLRIADLELQGVSRQSGRSLAQYWWDTLNTALSARLRAGSEACEFKLQSLVLEGTWSIPQAFMWDLSHDGEELAKVTSLGLAQEVVDKRSCTQGEVRWK
ncbi:unnamed protein product [Peniophora sp. CBMAI 1063]|nr:unnamed protein product [Peniophora sp. CBMAI 1063]